jgi:hypothetical protein
MDNFRVADITGLNEAAMHFRRQVTPPGGLDSVTMRGSSPVLAPSARRIPISSALWDA